MGEYSVIRFEELGSNCVDCGFILAGLNGTEGVNICQKIEQALTEGKMAIDVQAEHISFVTEGISCNFIGDENRLAAIKQMLLIGNVQREPFNDSNYQGFMLTRNA